MHFIIQEQHSQILRFAFFLAKYRGVAEVGRRGIPIPSVTISQLLDPEMHSGAILPHFNAIENTLLEIHL